MITSISFSDGIDLDTLENNDSTQFLSLIIVSSCTFLILLIGVLKTFVLDSAYSLGLTDEEGKYKVFQTISFSLLTILFVSCIYFLVDVALQDAYLQLGPVLVFQFFLDLIQINISGLTDLVGREFYQTARNVLFEALTLSIIIYLILAIVMQVTQTGRKRLLRRLLAEKKGIKIDKDMTLETLEELAEEEDITETVAIYKVILFIILPLINLFLLTNFVLKEHILFIPSVLFVAVTFLWWFYQLFKVGTAILLKGAKITPFLTSVNALLVIPPLLIFYVLPVLLLTFLELFPGISEGSTTLNLDILLTTLMNKITSFNEIIFIEFLLLTGLATCVIGFAEGASLLAIARSLKDGINFSRSGEVVLEQAPKITVWTKYVALLGVWFGVLLNTLGSIWEYLKEVIHINLPPFPFDFSFEFIISIKDYFQDLIPEFLPILLPMLLLLIPLYFILSASFKFLSVTVVTPRIEDHQTFVVIVSTTFILIIIQILADLWSIEDIQDAPLRLLAEGLFFTDIISILQVIEAVCFYIGLIAMFYLLIFRRFKKSKKAEIQDI